MDNRNIASFKRSFRDINYSLQQLNNELFKLSLKQFSLEKTLIEKGIINNEDTLNNLKNDLKGNPPSTNIPDQKLGSHNSTLEALARLAKGNDRTVKVINN